MFYSWKTGTYPFITAISITWLIIAQSNMLLFLISAWSLTELVLRPIIWWKPLRLLLFSLITYAWKPMKNTEHRITWHHYHMKCRLLISLKWREESTWTSNDIDFIELDRACLRRVRLLEVFDNDVHCFWMSCILTLPRVMNLIARPLRLILSWFFQYNSTRIHGSKITHSICTH